MGNYKANDYDTYDLNLIRNRVFPTFCLEEYPKLVDFVACYLEWMEENGNPYFNLMNLQNYTDVDASVDEYMDYLKNKFSVNFPKEYAGDTKLFLRNVIYLYSCKGTEESYRLFFRLLYDTFVEFYYPKKDMLRASDGKWNQFDYIYAHLLSLEEMNSLVGSSLKGQTSGATAYVTNVSSQVIAGGESRVILVLSGVQGKFEDGEYVFVSGNPECPVTQFQIDIFSRLSGYWSNSDGMLSSEKVIQDSYYYQDFSYELRTDVSRQVFVDVIKKTVHPAGLRMFNSYLSVDEDNVLKFPTKLAIVFYIWVLTRTYEYDQNISLLWHVYILLREKFPFVIRKDLESYLKHGDMHVDHFEDIPVSEADKMRSETTLLVFDNKGNYVNEHLDFWNFTISERKQEYYSVLRILPRALYWRTTKHPYVVPEEYHLDERNFLVFCGDKVVQRTSVWINQNTRTVSVAGHTNELLTFYWWEEPFFRKYHKTKVQEVIRPKDFPFKVISLEKQGLLLFCDGKLAQDKFRVENNSILCDDPALIGSTLEIYFMISRDMTTHETIYFDQNVGFKTLPRVRNLPNSKVIPSGWLESFSRELPWVQDHHLETWIPRMVVSDYADVNPYAFFDPQRLGSRVMVFNTEYGFLVNDLVDFTRNTSIGGKFGKYYSVFLNNSDAYHSGRCSGREIVLPEFKNLSENFFLFLNSRLTDARFVPEERKLVLDREFYGDYRVFFYDSDFVRERKTIRLVSYETTLDWTPDLYHTLFFCDGCLVNVHLEIQGNRVRVYNHDLLWKDITVFCLAPFDYILQDTRPDSEKIGFIYPAPFRLPLDGTLMTTGKTESSYSKALMNLPFRTGYTMEALLKKNMLTVVEHRDDTSGVANGKRFEGMALTFDAGTGDFLNPHLDYAYMTIRNYPTERVFNVFLKSDGLLKTESIEGTNLENAFVFTGSNKVPHWETENTKNGTKYSVYFLKNGFVKHQTRKNIPDSFIINSKDVGLEFFYPTHVLLFCRGKLVNPLFSVTTKYILCNDRDLKGEELEIIQLEPTDVLIEDVEVQNNRLNSKLYPGYRGFSYMEIVKKNSIEENKNGSDSEI